MPVQDNRPIHVLFALNRGPDRDSNILESFFFKWGTPQKVTLILGNIHSSKVGSHYSQHKSENMPAQRRKGISYNAPQACSKRTAYGSSHRL